ncbi:MAG: hypothetical protein ACE37J_14030 [Pikeienuella sp.]|uniref:hypothetical protein n=1 Tax=Pikeienuella sp. TaxID=2831957 RepID=UPI003918D846
MSDAPNAKIFPKGRVVSVRLEVALCETASLAELLEWAEHEFAQRGGVSLDNPLLQAGGEILTCRVFDSGEYALATAFDVEKEPGVTRYKRQIVRLPDRRTVAEAKSWKPPSDMIAARIVGEAEETT